MEIKVRGEKVVLTEEQVMDFKVKAFNQALPFLQLIKNEYAREVAQEIWKKTPDYFFALPASSSGKYHAEWSTDLGGLVRHVLMGVQVAYELSATFGLSEAGRDVALVAMFAHDTLKYGIDYDARYYDMHPFLPRSYFGGKYSPGYLGDEVVQSGFFDEVMTAVERHMGNLASGTWTSVGGVKPETAVQQVVHLSDYIASRKKIVLTDYIAGYQY